MSINVPAVSNQYSYKSTPCFKSKFVNGTKLKNNTQSGDTLCTIAKIGGWLLCIGLLIGGWISGCTNKSNKSQKSQIETAAPQSNQQETPMIDYNL